MAENIEFIAAKDLPEATGDEVSVLCLEDGKMKQKPGASLGGEKPDLVLKVVAPLVWEAPTADTLTVDVESGSLDAVAAALESGKYPVVKIHHLYDYTAAKGLNFALREGGVYDCSVVHYAEYIHVMATIPSRSGSMMKISMAPDDPDYLEVWLYPLGCTTIQVI